MARKSERWRGRQPPLGPLAPLPESDPPLYEAIRRSLQRASRPLKAPGYVILVLAVLLRIPSWKDDFVFYLDAADHASAAMGVVAAAITSPWAAPTIGVLGVLYLIFVGEPKKGILQSRYWPYLAWIVIAVCTTAVFVVFYTGYIIETFGPRSLSDSQMLAIQSVLKLPNGVNYDIEIEDDMTCADCGTYKSEIQDLISDIPGWHVTVGSVGGPSCGERRRA